MDLEIGSWNKASHFHKCNLDFQISKFHQCTLNNEFLDWNEKAILSSFGINTIKWFMHPLWILKYLKLNRWNMLTTRSTFVCDLTLIWFSNRKKNLNYITWSGTNFPMTTLNLKVPSRWKVRRDTYVLKYIYTISTNTRSTDFIKEQTQKKQLR